MRFFKLSRFITYCLTTLLASCTSLSQTYESIPLGSDKGYVVNALGSPRRTFRKKSVDHWVYEFHDKNETSQNALVEKEIWFQNGKVVFKDGDKPLVEHQNKPKDGPSDADFVPVN